MLQSKRRGREDRMWDVWLVVLVVVFFALTWGFVRLCARLR